MPFNKKREVTVTSKQSESSLRTSGRKSPGTRIGIMTDWRAGSSTSGKLLDRPGRSLRDGR